MTKALKLLFLISFIFSGKTYSQLIWTKTYQDTSMVTTSFQYNQSYVGFGYKGSKITYIRTDKNGDTLIERVIPDTSYTGYYYASSAARTLDNKLIVAGIQNVNSSNEALRLYKLDSLGHIIWSHFYANTSPNGPLLKMLPTADSGFAVFGHNSLQGYLIKIDKNGNQIFRQDYGYNYMYPRDAVLNSDGSFTICGYQGLFGFTNFLFKTDPLGNILWTQSITSTQLFETMTKINSNYYVLGSRSGVPITLFKFNSLGNLIGQTSTGQNGGIYSMKSDYDKNIICSGSLASADSVGLLKLDTLGQMLCKYSEQTISSAESMSCYVDNDSNYVYAGRLNNRSFISKVSCKHLATGITNIESKDFFSIYPNPVIDYLFINNVTETKMRVDIFDSNGRVLISETIQTTNASLNLNELNSGIYFMKLYDHEKVSVKRIIKL